MLFNFMCASIFVAIATADSILPSSSVDTAELTTLLTSSIVMPDSVAGLIYVTSHPIATDSDSESNEKLGLH